MDRRTKKGQFERETELPCKVYKDGQNKKGFQSRNKRMKQTCCVNRVGSRKWTFPCENNKYNQGCYSDGIRFTPGRIPPFFTEMYRTLCDHSKGPCVPTNGVNKTNPLNGTPLSNNGDSNRIPASVDNTVKTNHEVITRYTDREREEQLVVLANNRLDMESSAVKFNYGHPKVHSESQCHKTIAVSEAFEMLEGPLHGGLMQHLCEAAVKYQPRFESESTVLGRPGMKLHFNLTFLLLLLILLTVMGPCKASPAHLAGGRGGSSDTSDGGDHRPLEFNRLEYLMRYGYLPQSYLETGALRSKAERDNSIQAFQKFASLPVTGNFDEATIAKMMEPRCGVADSFDTDRNRRHNHGEGHPRSKRYLHGPSKWHKNVITYRILNYSPQLEQHDVISRIKAAFAVWSRWVKLDFVQDDYDRNADILIKFARGYHSDGYPFDGPGLILAHAFFPGSDRGGDMHFDEDEVWKIDSSGGTDFFSVAVHEIGHSLGLAHSSVAGSLMYPWYQGYNEDFELHRDDIEGIQKLYDPRDGRQLPGDTPYTVRPHPETVAPPHRPDPTPRVHIPDVTDAPTPSPTPWGNQPPDPCTTNFDAITIFRNEIFMFKKRWFWRIIDDRVAEGYPVEVHRFFFGLPEDIEGFDAVYVRPSDMNLVVFSGDRYWVFYSTYMESGFPREGRPITELGFPADVKKIDAAFVWGYNLKTYFISGDMYWKYFEGTGRMAHNYPRDMSIWSGVKLPVDAAFKNSDEKVYFFHKNDYYEFNDGPMKVRRKPKNLNADWLGCKHIVRDNDNEDNEEGNIDRQDGNPTAGVSGLHMPFGQRHGSLMCTGIAILLLFRSML